MANKFLYFADSANEQYIVPVGRLLGADDTDADTIVLNFEDMNGNTETSAKSPLISRQEQLKLF